MQAETKDGDYEEDNNVVYVVLYKADEEVLPSTPTLTPTIAPMVTPTNSPSDNSAEDSGQSDPENLLINTGDIVTKKTG